jgi:transposase
MRFAGIDIASQTHVMAVTNETGDILVKPTAFGEDIDGYEKLFALLGSATDLLVAMEATGHYGRNLLAALGARGYQVALLNPLRTRRFAQEDLRRAKNDSIDAVGISRFAAQKRPAPTPLLDDTIDQLREFTHLFERLTQDLGDRVRQVHRLVDLGFPEFTRHVPNLCTYRATSILAAYPSAQAFCESCLPKLAMMRYDGSHAVGQPLATTLIKAAGSSVGRHHGHPYSLAMRYFCQDLDRLRRQLAELHEEIDHRVAEHPVGSLLTTIDGLGTLAVARLLSAVGDPARLRSGAALASYVGAVPGSNKSGLRWANRASLSPLGNARLRRALFMTTLGAVRRNPWLRAYYERLRARGKLPKVALLAAMRKLLMAVYSVAKHRQPFVPRLPATGELDQ